MSPVAEDRETSVHIQRFFTCFAESLRSTADPLNLFVTGGETARTVIDALALETTGDRGRIGARELASPFHGKTDNPQSAPE